MAQSSRCAADNYLRCKTSCLLYTWAFSGNAAIGLQLCARGHNCMSRVRSAVTVCTAACRKQADSDQSRCWRQACSTGTLEDAQDVTGS